jgi:hypothetical protein
MEKKQLNEKNLSYDLFGNSIHEYIQQIKPQHRQLKRLATRTHQTSWENQGARDR